MNTTLKHWKEAATLVLAAGHGLGAELSPPRTRVVVGGGSLGGSQLPPKSHFDYDVLMLKRSSKSGFMPSAHVFPGGLVDASDFASEWLDIFKPFAKLRHFGLRGVKQSAESRPPIFATDRLQFGSPVPAEVAFRICALRETFEECGVLLSVSMAEAVHLLQRIRDRRDPGEVSHAEPCGAQLGKWRELVNQHPANFVRMCQELEVLPNIWALYEWGNWLTPAGRYGVRRFDTAFFMCCVRGVPQTLQDEKEIVQCQWFKPSEILRSYQARELWIAPPQFYELSRMCRFPLLSDLQTFASQRASEGCEQLLPVILSKDTHFISVLPGDRLYPPNAAGVTTIERVADSQPEDPEDSASLHRIVTADPYTTQLQITITPKYNHLLPVVEPPAVKSGL